MQFSSELSSCFWICRGRFSRHTPPITTAAALASDSSLPASSVKLTRTWVVLPSSVDVTVLLELVAPAMSVRPRQRFQTCQPSKSRLVRHLVVTGRKRTPDWRPRCPVTSWIVPLRTALLNEWEVVLSWRHEAKTASLQSSSQERRHHQEIPVSDT